MATKTFSGRAEEDLLSRADAISQRDAGMSFGQFCGTHLASFICENDALPHLAASKKKSDAFATLRSLARSHGEEAKADAGDASVGRLSDSEIKDLIASRYA